MFSEPACERLVLLKATNSTQPTVNHLGMGLGPRKYFFLMFYWYGIALGISFKEQQLKAAKRIPQLTFQRNEKCLSPFWKPLLSLHSMTISAEFTLQKSPSQMRALKPSQKMKPHKFLCSEKFLSLCQQHKFTRKKKIRCLTEFT